MAYHDEDDRINTNTIKLVRKKKHFFCYIIKA